MVFTIDGRPFTTVEKLPKFDKWAMGIQAGATSPLDTFTAGYDPGFSSGGYIGYNFSPNFSLAGMLGYNGFKPDPGSAADDIHWWNISVNIKSHIPVRPFRLYINAGTGIYISNSGALEQGFNVGAGLSYSFTSRWAVDLGADYHRILIEGFDTTFFLTYARLVCRF
jgi:opacity protein-like surface antigen